MTCINRFFRGGENDRVSDAATLEMCEDPMTGRAELRENATSEADFDESDGIMEAQAPAQITANSGTLSGLDKVATQPGDAGEQEQGDIRGSAIENRKSKMIARSRPNHEGRKERKGKT